LHCNSGMLELAVEDDGVGNAAEDGRRAGIGTRVVQGLLGTIDATLTSEPVRPDTMRPGTRQTLRFAPSARRDALSEMAS
jgi:two-component sensor histidine kinase